MRAGELIPPLAGCSTQKSGPVPCLDSTVELTPSCMNEGVPALRTWEWESWPSLLPGQQGKAVPGGVDVGEVAPPLAGCSTHLGKQSHEPHLGSRVELMLEAWVWESPPWGHESRRDGPAPCWPHPSSVRCWSGGSDGLSMREQRAGPRCVQESWSQPVPTASCRRTGPTCHLGKAGELALVVQMKESGWADQHPLHLPISEVCEGAGPADPNLQNLQDTRQNRISSEDPVLKM